MSSDSLMQAHTLQTLTAGSNVGFGTSGVRGLVTEMTDALCYAYTKAFLQTVASNAKCIVIGHDLRPSSPHIAAICATAAADSECEIIYAGALPTPAIAYYASLLKSPALIVTGSHIPFDRNGIKFYSATGEISKADEQEMLRVELNIPATIQLRALPAPNNKAHLAYVQRYISFFGSNTLLGMRVAIYEHSSVGRDVLREIIEGMGATVILLGRSEKFVPIDTEAVRSEDITQAALWAQQYPFDAIITTDGDADRPLIGDETGTWLRGDIVGILCAKYLKAQNVATPVNCNTALERSNLFNTIARTRIGSPFVIAAMEKLRQQAPEQVVIGYEANGGFLLGSDLQRDNKQLQALPTRDAVLPILSLLCSARTLDCKISELALALPGRYTASDRLQQFPTSISLMLMTELQSKHAQAQEILAPDAGDIAMIDNTDGLRLTFANGDIVHLRPSGNAPELRCYTEAASSERATELCSSALQRLGHLV